MARKKKEKTVEELRAEFFAREQKAYDERMAQAELVAQVADKTAEVTEDSDDTDETDETEKSKGE